MIDQVIFKSYIFSEASDFYRIEWARDCDSNSLINVSNKW